MRFLWIFLLLPIIEIALFVVVGGEIGVWAVLGLVVLAAFAGVALIRWQGMQAALDLQQSLDQLRDPARPMAHRTLLALAGILLIVPGFFTDALALLLLLPPVRNLILRRVAARARGVRVSYGFPHERDAGVIDGEYVIQDDPYLPPETGARGQDDDGRPGNSGWTRH
ncbi:FxsA family protein [uncultured Paracoccus sp.]|uniref:FxsA family protein n=1 Tax=uncultured Paracoccus sp. TaxID=189685 RepID=UPI0025E45265|nr:FxsA family protein [uncultured Paracoccus sp.]